MAPTANLDQKEKQFQAKVGEGCAGPPEGLCDRLPGLLPGGLGGCRRRFGGRPVTGAPSRPKTGQGDEQGGPSPAQVLTVLGPEAASSGGLAWLPPGTPGCLRKQRGQAAQGHGLWRQQQLLWEALPWLADPC